MAKVCIKSDGTTQSKQLDDSGTNIDGFVEVVRCAKYLANQGIAYRGITVKKDDKTFDSEPHGNFTTLLKYTATYHSNLRALLARDLYISPKDPAAMG